MCGKYSCVYTETGNEMGFSVVNASEFNSLQQKEEEREACCLLCTFNHSLSEASHIFCDFCVPDFSNYFTVMYSKDVYNKKGSSV